MASKLSKVYFLICNRFGSAGNTAAMKNLDETQGDEDVVPGGMRESPLGRVQPQSSPRYGCDNDCSAAANSSAGAGPPSFRDNTPDYTQAQAFDGLVHEIQELREYQGQLEGYFENVKDYYQRNYTGVLEGLQEKQYRCEQSSDLTELYQNEILNVKEELASTEDKVAYLSHERAIDIHEALEACHTHLEKLEQQQQVVELEGLDNVTAWTLFGKVVNMLLAVMAVLLVCVSNCVVTLMRTRSRTLCTLVILFPFLWSHWDVFVDNLRYLVCTKCPEKGDNQ